MGFFNYIFGDKEEYSPIRINNPKTDLSRGQKLSVIGLMCFFRGFCPPSIVNVEIDDFILRKAEKMGLSMSEVTTFLRKGDDKVLLKNLRTIRDRKFLNELYRDCDRINNMSHNNEARDILKMMYMDIGYSEDDIIDAWLGED